MTAAPLRRAAPVGPVAPELPETALPAPKAVASPVLPEEPELPEMATPPRALTEPPRATLTAARLTVAAPVAPVGPESPDWAMPLVTAVEVAGPVSPLLVELDWALASPE